MERTVSRRNLLKGAAYAAPALTTMSIYPSFASAASGGKKLGAGGKPAKPAKLGKPAKAKKPKKAKKAKKGK